MRQRKHGFCHYVWLGFKISLLLVLGSALYSIGQVHYYSIRQHSHPADAVIVLGAAAWDKRPSPVFRERINHAITLYKTQQAGKLIFTGGTPKPGFMSEAEVGRRYAIQQGVPKTDILYENRSRDTYQNLVNAKQVANNNNINSVIIVSDPYHMARAAVMAHDLDLAAQTSPTPTSRYGATQSKIRFLLQESYLLTMYRWLEWSRKPEQWFHPRG